MHTSKRLRGCCPVCRRSVVVAYPPPPAQEAVTRPHKCPGDGQPELVSDAA